MHKTHGYTEPDLLAMPWREFLTLLVGLLARAGGFTVESAWAASWLNAQASKSKKTTDDELMARARTQMAAMGVRPRRRTEREEAGE